MMTPELHALAVAMLMASDGINLEYATALVDGHQDLDWMKKHMAAARAAQQFYRAGGA
jgi:hypothetical protein